MRLADLGVEDKIQSSLFNSRFEIMEKEQEREWTQAQEIQVSIDLVVAAKKQLEFLAAVDRNRHLYEGPALEWAIYRYNAFWLPLLAKHGENPASEEPLVVPLDCEWIWHCHRLNPVRYKLDCEQLFGRILGNHNVISSVEGTSKSRTEEIWKSMYPEEPYELELNRPFSGDFLLGIPRNEKLTNYDLVSAVTRQIPFSFQVSRPHMSNDLFLREAAGRYKGFLHLIRTNRKKNTKRFCVPTYDIDLIWHSHQLNPISYCEDLIGLLGKVLEHDDTDSDRTKGKKLDTGFSDTTKQWEETFGLRYWKAGAMYRGAAPKPVTNLPFPFIFEGKKFDAKNNYENLIQFPTAKTVEVLFQFVEIKNIPEGHKGNLLVSFSKKQPDKIFNTKRTLSIFSECGEKQVALFQCEPTGEFLFELISHVHSNMPIPKSFKSLGSCTLSLQEVLNSASQFSLDKWLSVVPKSGVAKLEPILLHVSISFTIPLLAPQVYHLVRSRPFSRSFCFSPLIGDMKSRHAKSWTRVVDDDGNDVINLQMRSINRQLNEKTPDLLKEVYYITDSGNTHTLAELIGKEWCIRGANDSFKLRIPSGKNDHLFELVGHKMVKLFPGRRLEYESKQCEIRRGEQDFVTAVEFSSDYPYGRAVALIEFRSGTIEAKDEWMVLPGITLTFILCDILKREGYSAFTTKGNTKNIPKQLSTSSRNTENIMEAKVEMAKREMEDPAQGISQSGGSAGCGSGCGNAVKNGGSGGCGSGCGAGCGNAVKSGACGGCGAGCGNAVKSGASSGCGGACGGGGCGGACGGGCRNTLNSGGCGGCGGCGGGGCGNYLSHADKITASET